MGKRRVNGSGGSREELGPSVNVLGNSAISVLSEVVAVKVTMRETPRGFVHRVSNKVVTVSWRAQEALVDVRRLPVSDKMCEVLADSLQLEVMVTRRLVAEVLVALGCVEDAALSQDEAAWVQRELGIKWPGVVRFLGD